MILCLRTDTPDADVVICQQDIILAQRRWTADRTLARDLLKVITEVIVEAGSTPDDIAGVVVYRGPGSFTGLRIGCTTANTFAYAQSVPIVGTTGDAWMADGVSRLASGDDERVVLPEYGSPPRITQPKK